MSRTGSIKQHFRDLEDTIRRYSAPIIFFLVLILLIGDIIFPSAFELTFIHVALIGVLLILPYVQYIQRVKWGPFEAELDRQIEETRQSVATLSATANDAASRTGQTVERQNRVKNQLLTYADDDPKVAVSTLWIELEDALRALIQENQNSNPRNFQELFKILHEDEDIPKELLNAIHQIRDLRNEALHGGEISKKDAYNIIDIGTQVLAYLYNRVDPEDYEGMTVPETN
ncbi:DUF4145 domain-containing protein [Haladaptatus sp. CMAA 1911]|uniref:DUF4145 domain-containing protein n=1 Tax=unclassified Haladaptatus TaxID=2622732 RepID=UPI003754B8DE